MALRPGTGVLVTRPGKQSLSAHLDVPPPKMLRLKG